MDGRGFLMDYSVFPEAVLTVLPYAFSGLTSLAVGWLAWRKRSVNGSTVLAAVAFIQAFTTVALIAQMVSVSFDVKQFWDGAQIIGMGWVLFWFAFVLRFTGRSVREWFPLLAFYTVMYLLIVFLSYSDSLHHLVRIDPHIVPGKIFSNYDYREGVALLFGRVILFGILVHGLFFLIQHTVKTHSLYRMQGLMIIASALIILAGEILSATVMRKMELWPLFPFTFAISNLLMFWGLFSFRLFEVAPVAREWIFENLPEALFVLDSAGRVVDRNEAAAELPGVGIENHPGQLFHFGKVGWEEFYLKQEDQRKFYREIMSADDSGRKYEVNVRPLFQRKLLVGKLVLIRPIDN